VVCLAGGASGILLDELLAIVGLPRCMIPVAGNTRIALMVYERSTGLEYRFILRADGLDQRARRLPLGDRGGNPSTAWSQAAACPPDAHRTCWPASVPSRARGAPFVLDSSGPARGHLGHTLAAGRLRPQQFRAYRATRSRRRARRPALPFRRRRGRLAEIVAVTLGMDGGDDRERGRVLPGARPEGRDALTVGAGDPSSAA
jgi:6-phosphofructokinase 2